MIVLRGATTITNDTKEEISIATGELLDEIVKKNNLNKNEFRCIVFSLTNDIHSYHPAKAAREHGYDFCPLFACIEPEIEHCLKKCIRVMLFVESDNLKKATHIYLKEASKLRKDLSNIYNIALDGPAGSGKSTIAKIIAEDYNILYLDTGAMYRACALKALNENIPSDNEEKIKEMIDNLNLEIEYKDGKQVTILDGIDVSESIRENRVSMAASNYSVYPCVREKMVEMQRKIAAGMSCVLDGRDIGSVVLPNAKFKFYVTADSKVRAQRRYDELVAKGQEIDFEKLHTEIKERDLQDTQRKFSPLKKADDAIVIDTTNLNIDEVVLKIKSYIQKEI